jgi:uncharacterized protein (DUF488 family)
MNTPELWTIGHSNYMMEVFLGLLKSHEIQVLADVRRYPGSRRYPHFNAEELSAALEKAGIEYVHLPELGGRRSPRKDSPNGVWKNEMFRGYADHMMTEEFHRGMERLLKIAGQRRTAVMCAEVLWWQCHRSLIADFVKANGGKVWHILGAEKIEEHPFTSAARIVNGKLSYSPEAAPLEFAFDSEKSS